MVDELMGRSTLMNRRSSVEISGAWRSLAVCVACAALVQPAIGSAAEPPMKMRTTSEILEASPVADWRVPDPENVLYLDLAKGRVVIELAPTFSPEHARNIRTLVRQKYFDDLAIVRAQDNFVVQWGDPEGNRSLGSAHKTLPPEFTVKAPADLPWTSLPDADGFAPEAGFSSGFPAGRDRASGDAWLAHCYGMVGVGRANEPESGNGAELYVVIGHAPRQLDRNIAVVGRVIKGMELLSTLPRGTGALGFYETEAERTPIVSVRVAADLPVEQRDSLELLRTDTPTFAALIEARRNRRDDWYQVPAGYVDLCNVPLPVRARESPVARSLREQR
jgi:peptidylprolyl isomerase